MPQIVMLNHAAWVNQERSSKRAEADSAAAEKRQREEQDNPVVLGGKTVDKLNDAELALYFQSMNSD